MDIQLYTQIQKDAADKAEQCTRIKLLQSRISILEEDVLKDSILLEKAFSAFIKNMLENKDGKLDIILKDNKIQVSKLK